MVLGLELMNLLDWNRLVDHGWLDNLPLDDRLNSLIDVVVDSLVDNGCCRRLSVLSLFNSTRVLELRGFGGCAFASLAVIPVAELALHDALRLLHVLLGENLLVVDGLHLRVLVVLVDVLVDDLLGLHVRGVLDALPGHGRVDRFLDSGVMLTLPSACGRCVGRCLSLTVLAVLTVIAAGGVDRVIVEQILDGCFG
jgi:hypothetical protein